MTDDPARSGMPHGVSAEQLVYLAEQSLDLLSIAGEDGFFRWVNDRWTDVLGWSKEELYARPFFELVHPDDLQRTIETTETHTDREVRLFRNRYRHRDGSWHVLEWNAVGRDGTYYCVTRDVTEAEEARLRAREQERLVVMAEQLAGVGHWHVDLRTEELYWSDEVYRIHGLDPDTFRPTVSAAVERYHPDDRPVVERALEKAIGEAARFEFELRIVRPDGSIRNVNAIGLCLTNDDGAPVSLFGVFQDITDQHRMLTRMAQADRMASLGTLAAGVAHEINNPLTWVMGTLDLLAERIEDLPEATRADLGDLVQTAVQGTERVAEIASGLKTFSRLEPGDVVDLDVCLPLEEAVRMTENQIRHRARLDVDCLDDLRVKGRYSDLVQVFTNLLVNAVQAIDAAGEGDHHVRISTRRRGTAFAVVEIVDDGTGIPAEVLQRVFEPFFSTREGEAGTGLGLAICHGLVTSMGGALEIASPDDGGTCVRVVLPLVDPIPHGARQAEDRPVVLLVEDEAALRSFVSRALPEARVVTAEDGLAAVKLLQGDLRPDLILCDVMMPRMDGRELHREVSRRWPGLVERMVFTTGGTFKGEVAAWAETLTHPILRKPFRLADLRSVFEGAISPG